MAYDYIIDTGLIIPDTNDILKNVQAEYKQALGQDLDVSPQTPQGRLIAAETEARTSLLNNNAKLANQISPNEAGGVFLYAIAALTGLTPSVGTHSVVEGVSLTGIPETIIPEGSRAATSDEDLFETTSSVQLDSLGAATVTFRSVEFGEISCPIEALNLITTQILGWETVTNTAAAVLGKNAVSDDAFRKLRRKTLALQGISLSEAITSALWNIDGVKGVRFYENYTNVNTVVDGVDIFANSIWVAVDGGKNSDIAAALLKNKTGGTGYSGDVTETVIDEFSGQSYAVKFSRPVPINLFLKITVKRQGNTGNISDLIKAAALRYITGDIENEVGFQVGENGSPFEVAAAINSVVSGVFIKEVSFSKTGSTFSADEIIVPMGSQLKTTIGSITVIVT